MIETRMKKEKKKSKTKIKYLIKKMYYKRSTLIK